MAQEKAAFWNKTWQPIRQCWPHADPDTAAARAPDNAVPSPWLIAIGASGGDGLLDITALLTALGPDTGAIVLIVLHRPFSRPSHLPAILARTTPMPVIIPRNGERLMAGSCYIGEPNAHLALDEQRAGRLIRDSGALYRNRTIDLLFRSVAAHGDGRMIGVVLSGTLDDGSHGLAAIHRRGGRVMVREPSSSSWSGMPQSAIDYGTPIDCIGEPDQIAAAITGALTADTENAALEKTGLA